MPIEVNLLTLGAHVPKVYSIHSVCVSVYSCVLPRNLPLASFIPRKQGAYLGYYGSCITGIIL